MVTSPQAGDPGFIGPVRPFTPIPKPTPPKAGDPGFIGPTRPFTPIPSGGGGGGQPDRPSSGTPTVTPPTTTLQTSLVSAGLPKDVATALTIREQIKQESKEGAKGLSRLEIQRRLGGGAGVSALRLGTGALRRADVRIEDIVPRVRKEEIIVRDPGVPVTDFGERIPTAKEQIFQQSFEQPTTAFGRTPTIKSFEEDIFFGSLLQQQQEFEGLTQEQALERTGVDPRFVGMSTPEGEFISFTPDVARSQIESRQGFKELSRFEKSKLITGEVGAGTAKFALDIGTFTGDLISFAGQQKLEEDFKPFDLQLGRFGKTKAGLRERFDIVRDIDIKPTGAIGRGVEIGLGLGTFIFGGVSGIRGARVLKAAGFTRGEVIAESVGLFSPIRPKSGIFVSTIPKDAKIDFVSVVKKKGRITQRDIKAFGDDFDLVSTQFTTKLPSGESSVGFSFTKIKQPSIKIGGGKVSKGVTITKTEGFLSLPTGTVDISLVSPLTDLHNIDSIQN